METTSFWNRSARGIQFSFQPNPQSGLSVHVDWQEKITLRKHKLSEYTVYPAGFAVFIVGSWLIYRRGWLPLTLVSGSDLTPEDRGSASAAWPRWR